MQLAQRDGPVEEHLRIGCTRPIGCPLTLRRHAQALIGPCRGMNAVRRATVAGVDQTPRHRSGQRTPGICKTCASAETPWTPRCRRARRAGPTGVTTDVCEKRFVDGCGRMRLEIPRRYQRADLSTVKARDMRTMVVFLKVTVLASLRITQMIPNGSPEIASDRQTDLGRSRLLTEGPSGRLQKHT